MLINRSNLFKSKRLFDTKTKFLTFLPAFHGQGNRLISQIKAWSFSSVFIKEVKHFPHLINASVFILREENFKFFMDSLKNRMRFISQIESF